MLALRRLFGRAGLEERDVRILLGIARQIEWYADRGRRLPDVTAKSQSVERNRAPVLTYHG